MVRAPRACRHAKRHRGAAERGGRQDGQGTRRKVRGAWRLSIIFDTRRVRALYPGRDREMGFRGQAFGCQGRLMSDGAALSGLKVIDLSQRYAHYCGKLFADMGADVVLVEKPRTGCALRAEAPFLGDRHDPEYSIPFFYFNTSKRGVTLDLEQSAGRDLFKMLAQQSDLVIEHGVSGALDALGL